MGVQLPTFAMIEEKTELIEPFNGNALEYLQTIYRNPVQEQHTRMRAAALAIAYESPKLSVTASMPVDESFAALLDRARKRSGLYRNPNQRSPLPITLTRLFPTCGDLGKDFNGPTDVGAGLKLERA